MVAPKTVSRPTALIVTLAVIARLFWAGPVSAQTEDLATRILQDPTGYLYLVVGNVGTWNLVPVPITDADVAALNLNDAIAQDAGGVIPDDIKSGVTPDSPLRVGQGGDGTLYLIVGSDIWPFSAAFINGSSLMNLPPGKGTRNGVVGADVLQSAGGGSGPAAATPLPSAPDLSALKGFPGAVLVLPLDQPPYASWSFQGLQVYRGPTYDETVGSPEQGISADGMTIQGSIGGFVDDPHANFKPTCQPATPYCYYPPTGQASGTEIFHGLKARGNDAFVLHNTFPSEYWSLWWFDKNANTSYKLSFGGKNVITMFESVQTFSQSNMAAAQKLAAMASQLVEWTGS